MNRHMRLFKMSRRASGQRVGRDALAEGHAAIAAAKRDGDGLEVKACLSEC